MAKSDFVDWKVRYRNCVRVMDTAIATVRLGQKETDDELEIAMRKTIAKVFVSLRKQMQEL